ncbi:hypothetical protein Z043_119794, partial [Scleropages formosus]
QNTPVTRLFLAVTCKNESQARVWTRLCLYAEEPPCRAAESGAANARRERVETQALPPQRSRLTAPSFSQRGYSAKHEVKQFHFTSWPEHGVPHHATGLLAFLRQCEGVVDIYNCVKTLCSRRINMIQSEEQYVFIHEAILEACLCGETAIAVAEFPSSYAEMLRVEPQSNSSHLREEFQTLNSVTPRLDVEECSVALLPRNREKNRTMDVLPPDRSLAPLAAAEGESAGYINAALADGFLRPAAFVVTPHPLPGTTADFWRLVFDYGCTTVVMLNQLNQSNSAWPCLQYWPEPGLQHYGPMQVEFLSRSVDDEVVTRLFRVKNLARLQEGQLVVRQFQFLRWSAYRDVPDSRKAFLGLLLLVLKWQADAGNGRTVTLRNSKPNLVETLDQYRFCYDLALEYLDRMELR